MRRTLASIGAILAVLAVLAPTPAARSEPLGQAVSAGQGPWVAFVLLVGGLAVAILLIAAFGGGIGPRPSSGSSPSDGEEDHEHHEAAPSAEGTDEG